MKDEEELKSDKKKKAIDKLVSQLAKDATDIYYMPTAEVAEKILGIVQSRKGISSEDYELLKDLDTRDIQIIMSIHTV